MSMYCKTPHALPKILPTFPVTFPLFEGLINSIDRSEADNINKIQILSSIEFGTILKRSTLFTCILCLI